MTITEAQNGVNNELMSRNLKNPRIRINALSKILEYMQISRNRYIVKGHVVLPSDKKVFRNDYERFKCKNLNGAELSVINTLYEIIGNSSYVIPKSKEKLDDSIEMKLPQTSEICDMENMSDIENKLMQSHFISVEELDGINIPNVPGLYCIKIKDYKLLPNFENFEGKENIIYIGKASKSLRKRLWDQELHHKSAATFFRSIGALLGYLPPKGSLYGKSSNNYRFIQEGTEAIIKWMRASLLVNFVKIVPEKQNQYEETLIRKYEPIINIEYNSNPSDLLKQMRARCIAYAKAKSIN